MNHQTLIQLSASSAERFGSNILLWERREREYHGTTYGEVRDRVERFAVGLVYHGVRKGDRTDYMFNTEGTTNINPQNRTIIRMWE